MVITVTSFLGSSRALGQNNPPACPPASLLQGCTNWVSKTINLSQVQGFPAGCSMSVDVSLRYCPLIGYQLSIAAIGNITCPALLTYLYPNWPNTVPENKIGMELLFLQAYRQCADTVFMRKFVADSSLGLGQELPLYCDVAVPHFTEVRWYNSSCLGVCWRLIMFPVAYGVMEPRFEAKLLNCNFNICCEVKRSYCYERLTEPKGMKVTETVIADPGLNCGNCLPTDDCSWETVVHPGCIIYSGVGECFSPCGLNQTNAVKKEDKIK